MNETQIICGLNAVQSMLDRSPSRIEHVWVDKNKKNSKLLNILEQCHQTSIGVEFTNKSELDRLSEYVKHQGIVAKIVKVQALQNSALDLDERTNSSPPFFLILDGIQDPRNLGAILRTADAVGADAVIIPKHNSVDLTPGAYKTASGAADHIPLIKVTNVSRTLEELKNKGVWVIGLTEQGQQSLYDVDLSGPVAIVMGSEGKGLRRLTREVCDYLVSIPMHGAVSSLNVSVAAGIALYESLRQRTTVAATIK